MLLKEKGQIEGGNQPNTACQAIHVVEEVEGVGESNDPEKGHNRVQEWPGTEVERVAKEDSCGRGYDLAYQFGSGINAAEIIINADNKHLKGNEKKREERRRVRGEKERREETTHEKGKASQGGGGTLVPPLFGRKS